VSEHRRRTIGVAAVLLLVALFLLGLSRDEQAEPAAILYAIPVVLLAIAIGPAAGIVGGAAAGTLFWLADRQNDVSLDPFENVYRVLALVFLGGLAGSLASRLATAERNRLAAEREAGRANEQLARREELGRRAVELNDEVVQALALAGYLLEAGDLEAARAALGAALQRAQGIVGDLIEADEVQSGDLRRERPARTG
jgi:glucose-6-phosphate-specific signal transduction histidine kinase